MFYEVRDMSEQQRVVDSFDAGNDEEAMLRAKSDCGHDAHCLFLVCKSMPHYVGIVPTI